MTHRSRSLVDWLLLRAWIEPDHEERLRVVIQEPTAEGEPEHAFADADGAASFVRGWLERLVGRWEAGERSTGERRWGDPEGPSNDEGGDEER